ncbi:UNVERIFIED_CONTAM: hypothetical protein K2H54_061021 [Gekko kuhli]
MVCWGLEGSTAARWISPPLWGPQVEAGGDDRGAGPAAAVAVQMLDRAAEVALACPAATEDTCLPTRGRAPGPAAASEVLARHPPAEEVQSQLPPAQNMRSWPLPLAA